MEQQRVPQAQLDADRQHRPPAGRHRDLVAGTLPELDEGRRVAEELLAGRRQGRPGPAADEERPPELLFEQTHARADGGLAEVQPLGGADEASGRDDGEEGPGQLDVHRTPCLPAPCSRKIASKVQSTSFVRSMGACQRPR
jgi:hypothetical protein